jgi:hypothetical protein
LRTERRGEYLDRSRWNGKRLETIAYPGASYPVLFTNYNYNAEVEDNEVGRVCSTNGKKLNAYRLLVEKPEGKLPLGKPRGRWVDNITI